MSTLLRRLSRIYLPVGRYSRLRKSKLQRCFCTSSNCDTDDDKRESKLHERPIKELLDNATLGIGPMDEIDEYDNWQTSPYPKGTVFNPDQSQALKSLRPRTDPSHTSIILFPGQGSQYVGMGRDLLKYPGAMDIFDAANEILKYDLLKLMLHGPKEKLNQTKYCQPAVVVCSLAALEKLKEERPSAIENCVATAGFSVGEITALTFAGVFKFGDAIKLVRTRAEAMQLASELEPGGMATVVLSPVSKLSDAMKKAKEWCIDRGINDPECIVATYLSPHMKVISGHSEAIRFIYANHDNFGIRKVLPVAVTGAFHSNYMLPAVETFRKVLELVELHEPNAHVYSNIDAKPYKLDLLKKQLPKQIRKAVLWEQTLQKIYLRDREIEFPSTFICGPGSRSFKTLLTQINNKASRHCLCI